MHERSMTELVSGYCMQYWRRILQASPDRVTALNCSGKHRCITIALPSFGRLSQDLFASNEAIACAARVESPLRILPQFPL